MLKVLMRNEDGSFSETDAAMAAIDGTSANARSYGRYVATGAPEVIGNWINAEMARTEDPVQVMQTLACAQAQMIGNIIGQFPPLPKEVEGNVCKFLTETFDQAMRTHIERVRDLGGDDGQ